MQFVAIRVVMGFIEYSFLCRLTQSMKILTVGTVAFDAIESPLVRLIKS